MSLPGRRLRIGIAVLGLESANDFRSAGIARYGAALIDALAAGAAKNHEFHVYVMPGLAVPDSWKACPNIAVHRMWKRYTKWNMLLGGWEVWRRKLNYWVSTAHTVPLWSPAPTALMIHDLFALEHPEWIQAGQADFYRRFLPPAVNRAELVFANSDATRRQLQDLLEVADAKIVVTPLGPGNRLEPAKREPAVNPTKFKRFIFSLSTLEPRKNLVRLIESFGKVKSDPRLADLGLVIGGGKGWGYQDVLDAIDRHGLQNDVDLLGYVPDEDLPALFAACDFYVCPSLQEGFGMPVLEALIAGAPVVCSAVGALLEVGGRAARYFDPLDADSMAEVMSEALEHPESRGDWVEKGFQQAKRFSWDQTARLTVQALEDRAA